VFQRDLTWLCFDSASFFLVVGKMNLVIISCFCRAEVFANLRDKAVSGRNEYSGQTISEFWQKVSVLT